MNDRHMLRCLPLLLLALLGAWPARTAAAQDEPAGRRLQVMFFGAPTQNGPHHDPITRYRVLKKAVGVAGAGDLAGLDTYARVADQLLVDAKPPEGGEVPGGNGLSFDWRLIAGRRWAVPWMLAGGLTPENVGEAIRLTGARQVDTASGVESAPGVKDPDLMRAFIKAAQEKPAPKL